MLDLRVLNYFLTVAREESITHAAEALHLSQPTLSRQLRDMEEMLGKELMIRGPRRITLTEEGLFLKKRAKKSSPWPVIQKRNCAATTRN